MQLVLDLRPLIAKLWRKHPVSKRIDEPLLPKRKVNPDYPIRPKQPVIDPELLNLYKAMDLAG